MRNFNIFGVERNGKSNVIDRLEHLSVMKRILDGEVAAVNRKQKSSKVNYHNEAYENDSSGEEWTPENKPVFSVRRSDTPSTTRAATQNSP